MKDLFDTPALEQVLNESADPKAANAIEELHRLRTISSHLLAGFFAVKQQCDFTTATLSATVVKSLP